MDIEFIVQQTINALSLGSIYALLALGLAVVYSVMGMLNFAYGELVTITGYVIFGLISIDVTLPAGGGGGRADGGLRVGGN